MVSVVNIYHMKSLDPIQSKIDTFKYLIDQNVYRLPLVKNYKKGDTVLYNSQDYIIKDDIFGGIIYKIEHKQSKSIDIVSYLDLSKQGYQNSTNIFVQNPNIYTKDFGNYINRLYDIYYKVGIDFSVPFTDGYNTSNESKENFIGSILDGLYFDSVILKLKTTIDPVLGVQKRYDLIDGEKRVKTIIDFFEDRFRYKGQIYSRLSKTDQFYFKEKVFPIIILDENTPQECVDKIKQNQNIKL